ncbi:BRCT domain-containing protein [Trypanosoma conorhini]|uniref:BRCT domain-containing protein n=1 Tax=Trypanosoma conorhini TaxID=83891 RepID=A0A422Q9T4_9TRYP|nr:BRCT domain-containing protein [Trypanosoma conorhini]RNF26732.1 BRCT domain-containing protein [Trypanosoma conorhini]
MSEKVDVVVIEFYKAHVKANDGVLEVLDYSKKIQKENEERHTHLQLQLSNAEFRLVEQGKASAKKIESLLSQVRLLENQRDVSDKTKEEVLRKLSSVSNQRLAERNTKDEQMRELLVDLDTEKQNAQLIETKLQKLRKNFDYEVGRKREYKKALEEVKAKREEAERYRATEKDWAMKAINRANDEVNYWVRSFEKLKSMLDELSSRSGARVSAVDQATINRFEEARNRIVLRDQDVNTAPSDEETHRVKRARIE